jgi:hypothetical protein
MNCLQFHSVSYYFNLWQQPSYPIPLKKRVKYLEEMANKQINTIFFASKSFNNGPIVNKIVAGSKIK